MKSFSILILLVGIVAQANAEPTRSLVQTVELQVTEKGFEPSQIDVKPGTELTLKVTRKTDATCATAISIPSKNIKRDLPLNAEVKIKLGRLEKGEVRFACGMNMVSGQIIVR